jgi:F-type H+-transporting ATPase subunit epsilon
MYDKPFMLEIVTPEKIFMREEVFSVVLPEPEGEVGILANHSPLIAELDSGVIRYRDLQDREHKLAISGGFLKVAHNEARVLAETAEMGTEIDVKRATDSLRRAKERLHAGSQYIDAAAAASLSSEVGQETVTFNRMRAEKSMRRAISRLKAANAPIDQY